MTLNFEVHNYVVQEQVFVAHAGKENSLNLLVDVDTVIN